MERSEISKLRADYSVKQVKLLYFLIFLSFTTLVKAQPEPIAVFTFKNQGLEPEQALILIDSLRNAINKYDKYKVMDYATMNKMLQYNGFDDKYICIEMICAMVMGEFLSVHKVVQGEISLQDRTYILHMQFIDLQNETSLLNITENFTGEYNELFEQVIPKLAKLVIEGLKTPDNKANDNKVADSKRKVRRTVTVTLLSGLSAAVAVPFILRKRNEEEVKTDFNIHLKWNIDPYEN